MGNPNNEFVRRLGDYSRLAFRTIATQEYAERGIVIPYPTLLISDERGFYMGTVRHMGSGVFSVAQHGAHLLNSAMDLRICTLLDRYVRPELDKVALIPDGPERSEEARTLGEVISENGEDYVVRRESGQEVHVYALRAASSASRVVDGRSVGITLFNPPKK